MTKSAKQQSAEVTTPPSNTYYTCILLIKPNATNKQRVHDQAASTLKGMPRYRTKVNHHVCSTTGELLLCWLFQLAFLAHYPACQCTSITGSMNSHHRSQIYWLKATQASRWSTWSVCMCWHECTGASLVSRYTLRVEYNNVFFHILYMHMWITCTKAHVHVLVIIACTCLH